MSIVSKIILIGKGELGLSSYWDYKVTKGDSLFGNIGHLYFIYSSLVEFKRNALRFEYRITK